MCSFCGLHIVKFDFPISGVRCIRVRLRPMGINNLDLTMLARGLRNHDSGPYVVMVIFQVTAESDLPTD